MVNLIKLTPSPRQRASLFFSVLEFGGLAFFVFLNRDKEDSLNKKHLSGLQP